ncbi:MAG: lytic transglycosylase domain-containing protein [Chloroflexota bacterium]
MQRVHTFIITGTLLGCILLAVVCLSVVPTASATKLHTDSSLANVYDTGSPDAINLSTSLSATNEDCRVSAQYPESVRQWCGLITYYAEQYNLSPDLVAALIWLESGGNAVAYSKSGAVGLMQVMPRDGLAAKFQCVNGPCFADRPTIEELQDPSFNVAYGTKFLSGLNHSKGNLRDALKAYGPMNVGYSYADKVLGIYERYGEN